MRGKLLLIVSAVAAFHVSAANSFSEKNDNATACSGEKISSLDQLNQRLGSLQDYAASASYSVLLPSADDAVVYDVEMQSKSPAGPLSPCDYLISWQVDTPSGKSDGFTSYTDGNHFRYSDERMQEYHFDNDSIPFLSSRGVQLNARFTELLPAFIARDITRMTNDSTFTCRFSPDARFSGKDAVRLDVTETVKGYTVREITYFFNAISGAPLNISIESNPGSISEQSVSVAYGAFNATPVTDFSETTLINLFPETFERFRQGNFRLENLPGTAMPQFSLPTPAGDRLTYHRGDSFRNPTVIAVIDPGVASAAATVSDIRAAVDAMPAATDIIWAVNSRHIDTIEELTGSSPRDGETVTAGAAPIIRACGITAFPAIIFVGTDGIINSVHIGANKNLREIVMQKVALM